MSAQPDASPLYTVAVRALCEFGLRRGDLDQRFSGGPTAQEGIEGHALVASRRGAGYQRELALEGVVGALRVRGRADGYDPALHRLEEVKTHRGRLERQPESVRTLHWAQLMVYGALLCRQQGCADVELALVYLELGSGQETVLTRHCTAAELEAQLLSACAAFEQWARLEAAHRAARDAALQALAFPHAAFRPGQRTLAEAVYRAARGGRRLLAQAPTGIGKTVGTLFPLLKAVPGQGIDRIAFLTAKTSGRALALDALGLLRGSQGPSAGTTREAPAAPQQAKVFPLRVLELVAREKSCEHPDKACHGGSCPLAAGFHDRLPAARLEAVSLPAWEREPLRALAARHGLCPYYLGQELAPWADVFVGDYNHWFDPNALLHGLSGAQGWKTALLVDEAHNLVDRARRMYTAELDPATWRALQRQATGELKRALQRLQRCWREVVRLPAQAEGAEAAESEVPDSTHGQELQPSLLSEDGTVAGVARPAKPRAPQPPYRVLDGMPVKFVEALQLAASAVLAQLADEPGRPDPALLDFAFDALHFARLAAAFGPHALLDLHTDGRHQRLCLRNVVPAPHLQPRLAAAQSVTLFSATLRPPHHHIRLLGLPEDTLQLEVEAPFTAEQLRVRVARRLSTRWRHREASLARIVAIMGAQYDERPGNYLAFFSSYGYLRQVAERFAAERPDIPTWTQARGMSEAEQAAFIECFTEGGRGVGFAVLGGAFSEGIDLAGERLIGAFVATLGLPQVNPVNEQFRERLQAQFGAGFDHAYLYPGLQKVVQAAGRVIRGPEDRGVLHLLDERFDWAEVRALLPGWWRVGE
ncbi:ATP-dependent DNA helicase [Azohydromonas caseinilytica]|uniref:ATP-dependent DNA helicase n=1 Tax=Azohydromonas caseinilytica TaxID=2728836 RepID=A0A848FDY7_9BURK|nr:ATP-dependent DNA helicase [Azohydromonas caseinilytica]NML17608.1 ATP-dependent DNA helicase [Azohydromonas caseinilytica]